MRRFLTLVCLLCVAIPAGISISGCYRNPAGNYCNGLGYGLKDTDVASIFLSPQTTGISLAFGQTQQIAAPTGQDLQRHRGQCRQSIPTARPTTSWWTFRPRATSAPARGTGTPAAASPTTPSAISPIRCPRPAGCPTRSAYITASASSVTSNPVEVYVHAQVTSSKPCRSAEDVFRRPRPHTLDAQACLASNGTQ